MKNSGWHHKLWNKKLDELPVQENMDLSWSEMQSILDQQMPQQPTNGGTQTGGSAIKTIGSKIATMLGYILPAAAMVSIITYVALKEPAKPKDLKKSNPKSVLKQSAVKTTDSSHRDTLSPDTAIAAAALAPTAVADTVLFISGNESQNRSSVIPDTDLIPGASAAGSDLHEKTAGLVARTTNLVLLKDTANHLVWNVPQARLNPLIRIKNESADSKTDRRSARILERTATARNNKAVQISDRKIKVPKIKRQKSTSQGDTSLSYSISAGLNVSRAKIGLFFAPAVHYSLSERFALSSGLRLNTGRLWTGGYMASNYNVGDSLKRKTIPIEDERELNVLDIPLLLEYRITHKISFKAGPVLGIQLKQGGRGSKLGAVSNPADTLMNGKNILTALAASKLSGGMTLGYQAGFVLRFGRFNLETTYLQNLSPYRISSELGSYRKKYKNLQLGLGFRF
ncbi:hypothetical protein [Pedobacter sp. GR22-6]|uniref:hypothetical protein n=1 Tax=Pedobacter sp. GR22-6 TaxID=3127957 RepID=UPI00307E8D4A